MAVLAGKLEARRKDCAPVAGKSTLSRLEHAPAEGEAYAPARYHKIGHSAGAIEDLFVTLFLEANAEPPKEILIDLDARRPAARPPGRAFLPRLLRQLLLPAALPLLRPTSARGQAAALPHRFIGRCGREDRALRGPDPRFVARHQDMPEGRQGVCARRADDLVRGERRRLRPRARPQQSAGGQDRARAQGCGAGGRKDGPGRAPLQGLPVDDDSTAGPTSGV